MQLQTQKRYYTPVKIPDFFKKSYHVRSYNLNKNLSPFARSRGHGVLQAGDDEGNFVVTATVGEVSSIARFTVTVPQQPAPTDEDDSGEEDNQVKTPTGLKWKGEITPQKWMNCYTRVLSKLASDRQLRLTLKVEFSVEGEVSQQKTEETKVALQELGLDSDLETM